MKDLHTSLRSEIEKAFQRKILSHRDCIALQNHIFLSTEKNVALSSIRRLFGLVKYNGNFTAYTLSIFQEYVEHHQLRSQQHAPSFSAEWLLHFLENAPKQRINNPYLVQFIRSFYAIQLNSGHPIEPQLLEKIAQSSFGRRVFFDQFLYLDELLGSYGTGIQYYLAAESKAEYRAFAMCILALKHILLKDDEGVQQYLELLPPIQTQFHPFIQGRMRAIQWYGNDYRFVGNTPAIILQDMKQQEIKDRNYKNFPAYELMVLEMFWRTQDLELGAWLTELTYQKWKNYWAVDSGMDPGYYYVLKELMLKFAIQDKVLKKNISRLKATTELPQLAGRFYTQLLEHCP